MNKKKWKCGCVEGEPPVCQQHRTAAKRGALRRNKAKQAKYGLYTQRFADVYNQHHRKNKDR